MQARLCRNTYISLSALCFSFFPLTHSQAQIPTAPPFTHSQAPIPTTASPAISEHCMGLSPTIEDGGVYRLDLSQYSAKGAIPGGFEGALDTCALEVRNIGDHGEIDQTTSALYGSFLPIPDAGNPYYRRLVEAPGLNRDDPRGFYAYVDSHHNQRAVLVQPGGDILSPGQVILRVTNNGHKPIEDIFFGFRWYHYNDRVRDSQLTVEYAINDDSPFSFMRVTEIEQFVREREGASLVSDCEVAKIPNVRLEPGSTIFLCLNFNDDLIATPPPGEQLRDYDEVGFGSIKVATRDADKGCQSLHGTSNLVWTGSNDLTQEERDKLLKVVRDNLAEQVEKEDCKTKEVPGEEFEH